MQIKVILTGATGMVGEGVLLECLENETVSAVLSVSRKPCGRSHPKLTELIVPDFFSLHGKEALLSGYDACFYCAGVSSLGMNEVDYTRVSFDTPLHFARKLLELNPGMVFAHVSGAQTDSSEKGKVMWARVKGRAENALIALPFRAVYNFRPGFMKPTKGQRNIKPFYKVISATYGFFKLVSPNLVSTLQQVALAMINSVTRGYPKKVLEIRDIKELAGS